MEGLNRKVVNVTGAHDGLGEATARRAKGIAAACGYLAIHHAAYVTGTELIVDVGLCAV